MLDFLLFAAPRATLILTAAFVLTLLLRRASASLRHWIWVLALLSALFIPLIPLATPTITLAILPPAAPSPYQPPRLTQAPSIQASPVQPQQKAPPVSTSGVRPEGAESAVRPPTIPLETLVLGVWGVGVVGVFIVNGVGLRRIELKARQHQVVTEPRLQHLLDELRHKLGIQRTVRLMVAPSVSVPMTYGLFRPVILLPDAQWDEARLRFVLLHELAHIIRYDAGSNLLALLATALYWFNPFVWLAAKRLMLESETACDDMVLKIEQSHTGYAQHLLEIARTSLYPTPPLSAISPFVQRSSLAHRIQSILNTQQRREATGTRRRLLVAGLALIALLPLALRFTPVRAQTEEIVLSLRLPQFNSQRLETVIGEFEAEHPGVRVNLIEGEAEYPGLFEDTEAFYANLAEIVTSADVLHVPTRWLNPRMTLPGYILDLKPFTGADPDMDDFYPAALESFAWDGGQWALPTSFMPSFLLYRPEAFDAAGVDYPSADWTLSDLTNAIQALTVRDEDGEITTYGLEMFAIGHEWSLLTSLLQSDVIDRTTFPYQPDWTNPELQSLFEAYSTLQREGLIGPRWDDNFARPDPNACMRFGFIYEIGQNGYAGAPLPGGGGMIDIMEGLAISAGTQHPELAYELVKFLTTREEMLMNWGQIIPARKSLHEAVRVELPPEVEALLQQTIENGIPLSDTYYYEYLMGVLSRMTQEGAAYDDAAAVIKAAFDAEMAAALAQRDRVGTLSVAQPEPPRELAAGEVEITFGFYSTSQPFPNEGDWEAFVTAFAENDPQVGHVNFQVTPNLMDVTEYDCFYQPYSVETFDVSELVDLKPLMDADPNFDPNDFLPGAMESIERGGRVVGYPLTLSILGLGYNSERLGVLEDDWTIDQFAQMLEGQSTDDMPLVHTTWIIPTHLLMLTAAYGGMPIDYSSDELRFDFTSPQNIEAVRQALDLAKANYINYVEQPPGRTFTDIPYNNSPIETVIMQSSDVFGMMDKEAESTRFVLFPSGSTYAPMSVAVASAFISARSAAPEACYRLIAAVAEAPELLPLGIPVRRSIINDPGLENARGEDTVTFYQSIEARLDVPNAVLIPSALAGVVPLNQGIFFIERILYEAFDRYVVEDVPLETALEEGQITAEAYAECIAGLPPVDYAAYQETYMPYVECARAVAPEIWSEQ